jgi:hypothetical protein
LDGLYLADGPWGLDYMKTETSISSFMIDTQMQSSSDQYAIERNTSVSGDILVL